MREVSLATLSSSRWPLLYGQRVRLISPGAMYLGAINNMRSMPFDKMGLFLDRVGVMRLSDDARATMRQLADRRNLSRRSLQARGHLERLAKEELAEAMQELDGLLSSFQHDELQGAIDAGLVVVDRPPGVTNDGLFRQTLGAQGMNFDAYIDQLAKTVGAESSYTLIDTDSAESSHRLPRSRPHWASR